MTTRAMTAEDAAWVREHAWTDAMRQDYQDYPVWMSSCPCGLGPCGLCSQGDHHKCPVSLARSDPAMAAWVEARSDVPVGWVTMGEDRMVSSLGGADTWQVWEASWRHDGRCPCGLAGHPGAWVRAARTGDGRGTSSLLEGVV